MANEQMRTNGRFKPGNPGYGLRKAKGNNAVDDPGDDVGPPMVLRDMRLVYGQHAKKDKTPAQKALRKMFDENPKEFITQLVKLEQTDSEGSQQKTPPEKVDQGTQNALAAINNTLAEFEAQEARENEEFAKRPDAAAVGATLQRKLSEALAREEVLKKQLDRRRP